MISDVFAANPYAGWQQALDPLYPRGIYNYFRSAFLPAVDDRALRVLQESFATLPNPLAEIHLQHLGGAVGRVAAQDTAYALRDHEFIVKRHRPHPGRRRFRRGHRLGTARSRLRSGPTPAPT